jgi:hypothetical protein
VEIRRSELDAPPCDWTQRPHARALRRLLAESRRQSSPTEPRFSRVVA